ncbi:hypothetical protein CBR_g56860 [Chara braunii]|uniref:Uncharacterized protein n=1 Tax=Chara braunii TaxID=69332 RepID=A0A388MDT6_CHABU|nr:hypothetical protein CBR_g56860 [Chara braunii]|eukprot:GBG92721.1 hypothetical protein CBR_g56860 [Chara braunii]
MDFDQKIMELVLDGVQVPCRATHAVNGSNLWGRKTASEKAKKDLTLLRDANVKVGSFRADDDCEVTIRRIDFDEKCKSLLAQCMKCVQGVLEGTGTRISDVKEVVLVGKSTRIPSVVKMLGNYFGGQPKPHFYQEEAVVHGAPLFAGYRQQIEEIHPLSVAYYDSGDGCHCVYRQCKRPARFNLPSRDSSWRDPRDGHLCLHLFELAKGHEGYIAAGKIVLQAEQEGGVLPKLRMDRCGILSLDQGQASADAVLDKPWQPCPEVVDWWKQVAEKLTVYEPRTQWKKYIEEVEKREASCPRWLWSVISEWKRDTEPWPKKGAATGRVRIKDFPAWFDDFRRACEYAFGELWARSLSGRRISGRTGTQICVTWSWPCCSSIFERQRNVSIKFKESVAAQCFSFNSTPDTVKASGIPYVVLSTSPLRPSDDGDRLCRAWNKLVGEQVFLAVQAGLQVVLRLGRDDFRDEQKSNLPYKTQDENDHCEAQLRDTVDSIAPGNWRNVIIAYLAPPHLCWAQLLPGNEAAIPEERNGTLPQKNQVVATVGHIRKVIGNLVSDEAAKTVRILIGGCAALEMWNAIIKHDEVDGLLFEGGFRDPRLVEKLCQPTQPSRERKGKALLCRAADGDATLDESDMRWLHNISRDLMAGEEVDWITVKNVRGENSGVCQEEGSGSVAMVWKEGAVVRYDDQKGKGSFPRKVKICPKIVDSQRGAELAEAIEKQLSRWREKLTHLETEEIVVEYTPVPSVDKVDDLAVAMETAHAFIRRWIMSNISPYVAQAVRIVCSLDGLAPETHREITRQPNVDGLSLRLDKVGNAAHSAGNASSKESQPAEKLTVRSARYQWNTYVDQVEKRESSCPRWLWTIISEWKCDIEGWLDKEGEGGFVGIKEFTFRFAEFQRACEYAFGAFRPRPMSGRKFLVVDCWKSNDVEDCLQSLQASRLPDLCEVVISMTLKDLRTTKERIAKVEGVQLAAPCISLKATPKALTKGGIPYVLLDAGPGITGSGDPEDLCSGWNKLVGEHVSLALQAGLQVILRIGRIDGEDVEDADEAFELEEEKRHCEAQLRDIVSRLGKDFRNIAMAYLPPPHMLTSVNEAAAAEAASSTRCDVVEAVRHIRRVIGDLVNTEVTKATRILIGRCKTEDMWHALLKERHEIDGFLFEAGLRDPLLFDKLLLLGGPSGKIGPKKRGKVLLCDGQKENVTLSECDMVSLSCNQTRSQTHSSCM